MTVDFNKPHKPPKVKEILPRAYKGRRTVGMKWSSNIFTLALGAGECAASPSGHFNLEKKDLRIYVME
jgi:hypothetical protein